MSEGIVDNVLEYIACLLYYLQTRLSTETDNNNEGTRFNALFPSYSLPLQVVWRIRHIPLRTESRLGNADRLGCAGRIEDLLIVL
jgi:hypothetical protein